MSASEMFWAVGASLGLGFLVGLQRERAASPIAGIRTFPLITLLGAVCGLPAAPLGGWVVAAGLLGVAAVAAVANVTRTATGDAILIAALSNLVFKTAIAFTLGTRRLFWTMLGLFGATGVACDTSPRIPSCGSAQAAGELEGGGAGEDGEDDVEEAEADCEADSELGAAHG